MDLLLDAHAVLWFLNGDDNLSNDARQAIEETSRAKFVSIATIWEIAIKISLKKVRDT
jgi:PIN domain nuclease of toxin-antitoxin system